MKIDGLEWMDWLHKMRAEDEAKRRREGISRVDWLKRIEERARRIQEELLATAPPVVSDRPRKRGK